MKQFWLRDEIPVAEELSALIPALRRDFLNAHQEFVRGELNEYIPITEVSKTTANIIINNSKDTELTPWKSNPIKYTDEKFGIYRNYYENPEVANKYPTATSLTKKYGDDCPISVYSILDRKSAILRHTGVENRDNEYIRIHVPLIVPDGDIYFECEGIEIDWSDIWGFNNQLLHSAYNNTDHLRVVYIIDLRRSAIGLPPEPKYDPEREKTIPPFVRGALPKLQHKRQQ